MLIIFSLLLIEIKLLIEIDMKWILLYFLFSAMIIVKTNKIKIFAPVAQLDRALGYGPGGSGFKS